MAKTADDAPHPKYDSHESDLGWTKRDSRRHDSQALSELEYRPQLDVSRPRGPWWMLGYDKKSTLGLFVIFGGAILGYSLSRTPMLSFNELLKLTFPGEGYWYERSPGRVMIMIHVITSIPASFFSVFCFLPITYNRWPRFHGALGYVVSFLLVLSSISAAVLGRRGQGGDLNTQSAFYMLASGAAFAVTLGCIDAWRGALDSHREWMIRAWFYNGAIPTTKIIALLSAQVITTINTYYSLWQCAEVGYVLKSADALSQAYPQCATADALANPNKVHVAVHASWDEGQLGQGAAIRASYGMALWIAMIIHCVGVELYLRMTLDESEKLQQRSRQRVDTPDQTEMLRRTPR